MILPILSDEEIKSIVLKHYDNSKRKLPLILSIYLGDNFDVAKAQRDADIEALFKMARESPTGEFVIDSKIYNC